MAKDFAEIERMEAEAGLQATDGELTSEAKQSLTSRFVAQWEKKNARRAIRGGVVSTMALTLAACGDDDDDPDDSDPDTTPTAQTFTLTTGSDSFTGGSANDTFKAARDDTLVTLNSGDVIKGGGGTDTLTATLNGGLATSSITGVENLELTDLSAGTVVFSTSSETYISGVSDVQYTQSAGDITLTRITENVSLTLDNVVDDVTVTFADSVLSGSDDTFTLNVNGFVLAGGLAGGEVFAVGAAGDTDGDIENLVVDATGAASDFSDVSGTFADVSDVTVKGTADVDFGTGAAFAKLETFTSTASKGDVTLLLADDGVTGATNTKTLSFGSGKDSLDLGDLAPAKVGVVTVDMGSGNDTLDLDDFAASDMVIKGGADTDTLVSKEAISAANGTGISGFEAFELGKDAGTQKMTDISGDNTFKTVIAGAATTTFSNAQDVETLELKGGVAKTDATMSRLVDGASDSLTVKATTADATLSGDLTIDNEETVTFDSSDFNLSVKGDIGSTDLTSVTLTGKNEITLGKDGAKEFSSTKIATLDASGVTGTEAVSVFAINNTVSMTVTGPASTGKFTFDAGSGADTITAGSGIMDVDAGAGDDTITGGAKADVIDGDGGADNITGGLGADEIDGGAGRDIIDLTETTAAADVVTLSSGATTFDKITGFDVGGTASDDNLLAAQGTHSWNSTGGDTTLTLDTGADLKSGVDAAKDDTTAVTISTNVAAETFDNFIAGTMTEATMESNVVTALGNTGDLDDAAVLLVAVDDGEDTALFKFTSDDNATDDAAAAAEIEIMAVLDGVSDATSILAADVAFS